MSAYVSCNPTTNTFYYCISHFIYIKILSNEPTNSYFITVAKLQPYLSIACYNIN